MPRAKAGDKKKATRVIQGPSAPNFARSLGEALGRAIRPTLPLLALAVLYAGAAYLLWLPTKQDAQALLTKERLQQPILKADSRPVWLPLEEARVLVQVPLALEGRSVFEPGLARELGRLYEANPWIARVGSVKVRYPAALQVEDWTLRSPFARVELAGGYAVVDRTGHVLPMRAGDLAVQEDPAGETGRLRLPSITGLNLVPQPAGQPLGGSELQEGLDLLETVRGVLGRLPGDRQATRFVREAQGRWRIWMDSGAIVEWGYAAEERRPEGEPSHREKAELLYNRLFEWDRLPVRYIKLDQPRAPVMPR
ncbi:MAG: cell division protein FtsQ [Planctomycetes bacterium]|nr:cell division protein FtsQ [Planctomycetota bacterium]